MTMLSPAATFHAELRQQLESVERAISLQRGLVWLARGLAAGAVLVLGLVVWAWTRDTVKGLPIPLLLAVPLGAAIALAVGSMFVRHNSGELARRIDRAAGLQERSTTALELGRRGEEFPLALAQMRDAVEHLRRVDLLEAFPLRVPRNELLTAFFVAVVATIVALSPNPWLLRARASNPSITIAREQAQRVERLADSLPLNDSAEIDALRQLLTKGAQTIQARSNEPDAALNALQDLEEQVQQMSAGNDQLSAALAAIASALAGNQNTQALSDAINTGDLRQVSQAAKNLSQAMANMSPQDKQQLAQVLRAASNRAGSQSQSLSSALSSAADALQASAGGGDPSQAGGADGQQSANGAQSAQAASDALNQLSQNVAAADARQRTSSQLESSRNALERALGRTQSRSGNNNTSSSRSTSNSRSASNGQGASGDQSNAQSQDGQGQSGEGAGMDQGGSGSQGNPGGAGDDTGMGGGYSTGGDGQGMSSSASQSGLDVIRDPHMDQQGGGAAPDESSLNPYTSNAGSGNAQTAPQSVQPNYSNKPTQGNDSGSIPLGLRDLVKDYFSSLDQK